MHSARQKECGINTVERIGNRVSYIKKPLAKASFVAAGLWAASLLFCLAAIGLAYHTQGNAPLSAAALGFCSILTAVASLAYGIFAFFEKDKNYLLAKISLLGAGVLIFIWLIIIVIAL